MAQFLIKLKMSEENKIENNNISKYKDTEGITTEKLNFGLWIVEHKKLFYKILILFLIFISAILWSYSIYGFAYYIVKGMKEDEILVKNMLEVNTIGHEYIKKYSAGDLIYSTVSVLKAKQDTYDFFVLVKNQNEKYWASFDYCFLEQGKEFECNSSFILPNEEKYLLSLSNEFMKRPVNSQFITKNIYWKRINLHKIHDWDKFKNEIINFDINDVEFKVAQESGLSEKLNLNILKFTAINNTPYNYWEVSFNILLHSGNSIIGVNRYTLSEFMSGDKENVQLSWSGEMGRVSLTEIIPDINIMRDDIYIKYDGGIGEQK